MTRDQCFTVEKFRPLQIVSGVTVCFVLTAVLS